jgi:putative NIF3 family GTP cyclohydrolase 1 type 2
MSEHPINESSTPRRAWERREFVTTVLAALTGSSLLAARSPAKAAAPQALTIRHVIDLIVAQIPGAPFKQTVDTVKTGNPDQPVKGIVTTMFPTDAVIEKTIQLGANFIIAHEPSFYNHLDEVDWLGSDKVYQFKKDMLEKHGIVIWRFHDYWHSFRPDGILMGVLTSLGWEKYYDVGTPKLITLPATSLGDIVEHCKKRLGIEKVKVIGDLSQTCRLIALSPGAAGGRAQIGSLQQYKPDLFICGELNEWETAEYVRDARYQGEKTALLVLGHSVSEEPGMEWLVPWLQALTPGIRITHIASGDPFTWV